MATNRNITQNKPFSNRENVRRGSGPLYYKWKEPPFGKSNVVEKTNIKCNNFIDNVVTYVYNELPDGNHLAYVFCDYVE
jgi:hypothetical protein